MINIEVRDEINTILKKEFINLLGNIQEIDGIVKLVQPSMRSVQVLEAEMHAGVHILCIFPSRRASEIRKRSQDLRRQQRCQTAKRASAAPARRRRQLPGL